MTRARDLSRAVNNKMTVFKYTATAGQTTFTGADAGGATLAYDPNSMIVTYNGIILESVSEYTATNGTSVVLASGAEVGAEVNILAFEDVAYSGVMPTTGGTFTGNVNVNGNVGVGTTSPDRNLHVKKTDTGGTVAKFENSAGSTFIEMASSAGGGADGGYIEYNATKDLKFHPDDTHAMTIKADGKVGIGTEAPTSPLVVKSADSTPFTSESTQSSSYIKIANNNDGLGNFIGAETTNLNLWTENVKRLNIDGSGYVTKASQPFFMGLNYASTVGSDKASFNNIQQNGNNWNNSTGFFTCPTAGNYLVIASSGYKAADAYLGWGIKYNNSVDLYGWSSTNSNHAHATQCISYIKTANANDTFAAFIANHSAYTTPYVGNNYCAFSVYLLG